MVQQLRSVRRLLWVTASIGIVFTLADAHSRAWAAKHASAPTLTARATASALTWARVSKNVKPPASFEGFHQLPPALRDSIVALALVHIGARYEFGGTSPEGGFDCSGLVRYVLSQVDFFLPRTARQQALVGLPIDRAELKPGDLLTFGNADSVSHVGIYIGGGKYVHASSIAGRVIVSPIDRPPSPLIRPLAGARRLLAVAKTNSS